ncbi:MAG: Ig-like domain repeat protein [Lachnospiraceae bacterium]|nr:Ig-like domain repeat protein [Lachnospiraceae bacterium]
MRIVFRGLACGLLLLMAGVAIAPVKTRCAEKEMIYYGISMGVTVTREDGVNIVPKNDEVICSSIPLKYEPDRNPMTDKFKYRINEDEKNALTDSYITYDMRVRYSLADGRTERLSDWTDMEGAAFVLRPGTLNDGEYTLGFEKRISYRMKSDEEMAAVLQETDPSTVSDKERKEAKKKAEKIVKNEPCHIVCSPNYHVLLDSQAPSVEVTSDKEFDKWTSGNIGIKVTVNDSGSRLSRLKVVCGQTVLADEGFNNDDSYCGTSREYQITEETLSDKGSELAVEVYDRAGNLSTVKKTVKIDRTAPEIGISGANSGEVYNKPVRVSLSGKDAHPDSVTVRYNVMKKMGESEEQVADSTCSLREAIESEIFNADSQGDYTVNVSAADQAGNESVPMTVRFRVDRTAPSICFEEIGEGYILRTEGVLKINVSDDFADAYRVTVKGSVDNGRGTRDLKPGDYRVEGCFSSNTYDFSEDGTYRITVEAEDEAGNGSEESIGFVIDRTPPVVQILNGYEMQEEIITNEPPTISFSVTESNYETAMVVCDLKKRTDNGLEQVRAPEWVMDGEKSQFSITIDEEGSYELNVRVTDMAGNISGKTIRFTLDTTKPEIDYVDTLDKKYVKSFRLPDNFADYVKDESGVEYNTYLNSANYDGEKEVNEDGKYILKITAVDDAGNQAEKTVEFIVDGTQPRIVVDGMADDGSVNKGDVLILSLYDEEDYFISVKLNGEEMMKDEKQDTVEFPIPDYGDYVIEVQASDMAENVITQTIEAKCANAIHTDAGDTAVKTIKKGKGMGRNGVRILIVSLTVIMIAAFAAVYFIYVHKFAGRK